MPIRDVLPMTESKISFRAVNKDSSMPYRFELSCTISSVGPACNAILFRYSGESFVSSGLPCAWGEPGAGGAFRAGDVGFGHGTVLVERGLKGASLVSGGTVSRYCFDGKSITCCLKGSE